MHREVSEETILNLLEDTCNKLNAISTNWSLLQKKNHNFLFILYFEYFTLKIHFR